MPHLVILSERSESKDPRSRLTWGDPSTTRLRRSAQDDRGGIFRRSGGGSFVRFSEGEGHTTAVKTITLRVTVK